MKKLFPAMLAITMLATTPLTAFASGNAKNTGGDTEIDVIGKYIKSSSATTISVDIAWDDMSFQYIDGKRTWDPDTHQYSTSDGSWSNEKKAVSVTNHSNVAVKAEFSFASSISGISGSFDHNTLELETAVGKAVENAPTASTNFGVSGSKINTDSRLGTITLNISALTAPDSEQDTPNVPAQGDGITTYDQLVNALKNGGDIIIASDIEITNPIEINTSCEIKLNSHNLIGNSKTMFNVGKGISFTLSNGSIELNKGCCIFADGAQKVKFSKCKANVNNGMLCNSVASEIAFDQCVVDGDGTLIELSSASTLVFIRENRFIGQISKERDCEVVFSNALGSKFGFNPADFADDIDSERNDVDNTWTLK